MRAQRFEGGDDGFFLVARGRRQDFGGAAGVGDEADAVVGAQRFGEVADGFFHQRQFVGVVHRAGGVDEEDEVGGRAFFWRKVGCLDGDADEFGVRLPRGINGLGVHREGFAVLRQRVAVGEVVEDFFDAHGIGGRQAVFAGEHAADVAVAAGVNVNAEGGDGRITDAVYRVRVAMGVAFAVLHFYRAANAHSGDGFV